MAQFAEETTFFPRLGLDGVAVIPVTAAAPAAGAGEGSERGAGWTDSVPGERLTERSEKPSLFWFLSNHF